MPVQNNDFVEYLSAGAGSSGGAITGSSVTSGILDNLWPDITDIMRTAGGVLYRKTYLANTNATETAGKPAVYCSVLPLSMNISIGLGQGGGEADSAQGNMAAWSANAVCSVISDGPDTRQVQVQGLSAGGVVQSENLTMNGTSEVTGALTFSKVYRVGIISGGTDAARTITVRQGVGGTTRGTIGPSKSLCWLWLLNPSARAAGIQHPDLAPGASIPVWQRLQWAANIPSYRPNTTTLAVEETA